MKKAAPLMALLLTAAALAASAAEPFLVRNGPPWSPAEPRMMMSAAELAEHLASADAAVKAGKSYDGGPVVMQGRYRAQLEWRNAPQLNTNIHETDAELFVIVEGSGTMMLGGKLLNPRRAGPNRWEGPTLIGTGAEGAKAVKVTKGDIIMIPENTAHTVSEVNGKLVLWSLHLPDPGPNPPPLPAASAPVATPR
jgi:mannose-6-phosphate isomerase-like protein (cupin superfamily)